MQFIYNISEIFFLHVSCCYRIFKQLLFCISISKWIHHCLASSTYQIAQNFDQGVQYSFSSEPCEQCQNNSILLYYSTPKSLRKHHTTCKITSFGIAFKSYPCRVFFLFLHTLCNQCLKVRDKMLPCMPSGLPHVGPFDSMRPPFEHVPVRKRFHAF